MTPARTSESRCETFLIDAHCRECDGLLARDHSEGTMNFSGGIGLSFKHVCTECSSEEWLNNSYPLQVLRRVS